AAIARYILRRLQPDTPRVQEGNAQLGLTRREIDILWGIAKGLTYNEIADGLGISRKTVPNYIKSIYRKLEVNSRGEAVFEALTRNLIQLWPRPPRPAAAAAGRAARGCLPLRSPPTASRPARQRACACCPCRSRHDGRWRRRARSRALPGARHAPAVARRRPRARSSPSPSA